MKKAIWKKKGRSKIAALVFALLMLSAGLGILAQAMQPRTLTLTSGASGEEREERVTTGHSAGRPRPLLAAPQPTAGTSSLPDGFFTGVKLYDQNKHEITVDTPVNRNDWIYAAYSYKITDGMSLTVGTLYEFSIPEQLNFPNKMDIDVLDGETVVAIVHVTDNSRTATIEFTKQDYANPKHEGTFWMGVGFNKDEIGNKGKQDIEFFDYGGSTIKLPINFEIDQIEADVALTKAQTDIDLANRTITWQITVKPSLKNAPADASITNITLTDTLDSRLTYVANSWSGPGTPTVGTTSITCALPLPIVQSEYVITYKSKFDFSAFQDAQSVTFDNAVDATYTAPQFKKDSNGNLTTETENVIRESEKATATATVTANFITKEIAAKSRESITWEITINKDNWNLGHVILTDEIPEYLKLNTVNPNSYTYSGSEYRGGTLTMNFSNLTTQQVVTYTTSVDPAVYKKNQPINLKNQATLGFSGDGDGPGITIGVSKEVPVGESVIAKSSTYDKTNHTITWTIHVNQNKTELTGIEVTDTIPERLTLVDGSIQAGGFTTTSDGKKLTFTANKTESATIGYSISFKTTVDDNKIWAINNPNFQFTNTAHLTVTGGLDHSYDALCTQKISGEVLAKEGAGYDVTTKRVTWKLTVNDNAMQMTNAVITDTIPEGQKFVEGTLSGDYTHNYDPSTRVLTITLGDFHNKQTLTYQTELTNLSILNQNDSPEVSNSATLHSDEVPDVSVTAKQPVSKSVVTKQHDSANEVKGHSIGWRVLINQNLIPMGKPVLTDELTKGLLLDLDSLKLTQLSINPDGTEDTGAAQNVEVKPEQITLSKNESGKQVFTFRFLEDIDKAYALSFRTDIVGVADGQHTFGNQIRLAGEDFGENSEEAQVAVLVMSGGGSSTTSRGSIKITKVNENNQPLPGAVFSIGKISAETDASGIATFEDLKPGAYTVTEIKAPEGYLPANSQSVTVTAGQETPALFTDSPILGHLQVTKTDASGNPLTGAQIGVFKADGTPVATLGTSGDGLAVFQNLRAGAYYYQEKAAPDGYRLDSTKHSFTIMEHNVTVEETLKNNRIPPPAPDSPSHTTSRHDRDDNDDAPTIVTSSRPVEKEEIPPEDTVQTLSEETAVDQPQEGTLEIPEGAVPSVSEPPAHGSVALSPDGNWVYTPEPGFTGTDTFTIEVLMPDGTRRLVSFQINVVNASAGLLPNTGEPGRLRYYIPGVLLIASGLALMLHTLLRRKRGRP